MAKKNVGRLAGLAALGAAAYMMSKGKGKSDDAGDQKTSSYTKEDKKVEAKDEPFTGGSSYTGTTKNDSNAAKNIGFGGGDDSDKNLRRVEPAEPAPVVKKEVKAEDLPKANAPAEVKHGDPSQSKGVLRSDKDMTQAEAKTILNQTPEDKAKQAAKDKKDIASNKADFRAYQRNLDATKVANLKSKAESQARKTDARKASISTDEMKNRSRAQAAYDAKMKRLKANPESQALEASNPELFLTPGGGAKTVAGMAKNLANRNTVERSTAPYLKEIGREPLKIGKEPLKIGNEPLKLGMKRGGAVKMASGGMTASRRGDGIASRGKTRCKMY